MNAYAAKLEAGVPSADPSGEESGDLDWFRR